MVTKSILLVDDDQAILELLKTFLTQHHYEVLTADNGLKAWEVLKKQPHVDLVVLDIMMKGLDGISLCRQIRSDSVLQHIPIILLTAMKEDQERILGLELGADDYMTKPFNARELLARMKVIFRRIEQYTGQVNHAQKEALPAYLFDGWRLDTGTRSLYNPQKIEVSITAKLYQLLLAFLESPQRILTRDQLMDMINNRDCGPFDRSIDILVGRLRQKVEDDPKSPKLIKTVRSGGYMFSTKVVRA